MIMSKLHKSTIIREDGEAFCERSENGEASLPRSGEASLLRSGEASRQRISDALPKQRRFQCQRAEIMPLFQKRRAFEFKSP